MFYSAFVCINLRVISVTDGRAAGRGWRGYWRHDIIGSWFVGGRKAVCQIIRDQMCTLLRPTRSWSAGYRPYSDHPRRHWPMPLDDHCCRQPAYIANDQLVTVQNSPHETLTRLYTQLQRVYSWAQRCMSLEWLSDVSCRLAVDAARYRSARDFRHDV